MFSFFRGDGRWEGFRDGRREGGRQEELGRTRRELTLFCVFVLGLAASLNTLRPKGLTQIGMTSNGIALHRKLPEMVENGLTHLNISFVLSPSSSLVPSLSTFL